MKNEKLGKVCSNRHLPLELWTEILCRLPVKALLRFRCVSKPWLCLIEDAGFARLHLNNFKNNRDETHLLVVEERRENGVVWENWTVRCSVTFEPNSETPLTLAQYCRREFWCIISSIDGLVLLERVKPGITTFRELKVWNPSIRKFHELPSLPDIEIYTSRASGFMDANIGLGYDPLANDYKHVKLICDIDILHSVAIYSLGSGSWKLIPFQGEGCSWHWHVVTIKCQSNVYLRGSLYFIALNVEQLGWDLVSFDLRREVFSSIGNPGHGPAWKLVLIDGGCSLAVFDVSHGSSLDKSMWVLENSRDGSESVCWTKLYSFRLEDGEYFMHMKKNGVILTQMHHEETMTGECSEASLYSARVASYNPETEESKIVRVIKGPYYNFISPVYAYVESLNLLK